MVKKNALEKKAEKANKDVSNLVKAQTLFTKAEKLAKEREAQFQVELGKSKDGQYYVSMLKQGTL